VKEMKKNIYGYNLEDLQEYCVAIGDKKFRGTQIFEWLYQHKASSFEDMSNLSLNFRNKLVKDFDIESFKSTQVFPSKDGTVKFLFELLDGNLIETVLMPQKYGNSVCVTTQVGCNLGCRFCASGKLRKVRNLSAGEIVAQVLAVNAYLAEKEERVSHVVIMGIGEPFDNYDNVMKFIRIINHAKGLAIGARHITVSTAGLVDKILVFADEGIQVNLAVSLHSADNELRSKLMPVNKRFPLDKLMNSVRAYIRKTNRRVTFEYILMKGINDSAEDAENLCKMLKGVNCYVNLIPYNSIGKNDYQRSPKDVVLKFYDILKKHNIQVTIRREFGHDIEAACGQLRAKQL
jgi:23S rRNA (adenine2503-C2)-methyltransferase